MSYLMFTIGFIFGASLIIGLFALAKSKVIANVVAQAKAKEQQARDQSLLAKKKAYVDRNAGGIEVTQEEMDYLKRHGKLPLDYYMRLAEYRTKDWPEWKKDAFKPKQPKAP